MIAGFIERGHIAVIKIFIEVIVVKPKCSIFNQNFIGMQDQFLNIWKMLSVKSEFDK